jgi:hypothetical protein
VNNKGDSYMWKMTITFADGTQQITSACGFRAQEALDLLGDLVYDNSEIKVTGVEIEECK